MSGSGAAKARTCRAGEERGTVAKRQDSPFDFPPHMLGKDRKRPMLTLKSAGT